MTIQEVTFEDMDIAGVAGYRIDREEAKMVVLLRNCDVLTFEARTPEEVNEIKHLFPKAVKAARAFYKKLEAGGG